MIYNVTNDFTQLAETAGTIQNNSYIYPVEVSDRAEADSGILLYPLTLHALRRRRSMGGDSRRSLRCRLRRHCVHFRAYY